MKQARALKKLYHGHATQYTQINSSNRRLLYNI